MKGQIPSAVTQAASFLIEEYGDNVVFIGKKDNLDVYMYKFPEDALTGFPFVYLYDALSGQVTTVNGFASLDIIGNCKKDNINQ